MKNFLALLTLFFALNLGATDYINYICLTDRVEIGGFKAGRTFDEKGIMKTKKLYNPLVIAQYGILTYYAFLETSDSSYYFECLDQVKYFKDTSKVNEIMDGKGLGLPYNFKYKDMKSPWYSGMTQGYAASFLLRYHNLTNDESIIPIIQKIMYVLISPQKSGGTISTTKEGYKWIEEYPNSKSSPSVLNGSLNGFIGLKEYCNHFTNDKEANDMLEQVYEGMVNSLTLYDTHHWTYYNRKKHKIKNLYIRYQFHQIKQLYALFQDPVFDHQMRIWGMMMYGKKIKNKSSMYKLKNFEICVPSEQNHDGCYQCPIELIKPINSDEISVNCYKTLKHLAKNKKLKSNKASKQYYLTFEQPDSIEEMGLFNYIKFTSSSLEDIKEITVYKKRKNTYELMPLVQRKFFNEFTIYTDSCSLDSFLLSIEYKEKTKSEFTNFKFLKTSEIRLPELSYFIADTVLLDSGQTYTINLPKSNTKRAVILYRQASQLELLKKSKWINNNVLSKSFTPKMDGYYEFSIVFDIDNPLSMVGELQLIKD